MNLFLVTWSNVGRLGPNRVVLDRTGSTGSLVVEADHLEVM